MSAVEFFSMPSFSGDYAQIPPHMQDAIERYLMRGLMPGDFLTGVITNDLVRAIGYADDTNIKIIKLYVQWFYNMAPSNCWGSKEKMQAWAKARQEEYARHKATELAPTANE